MRNFVRTAGLLALASGLAMAAGTASAKDMVFGFIPNDMAFPYDVVLADGFKEAAAKAGAKVILLDSKMSMEKLVNLLKKAYHWNHPSFSRTVH